MDDRQPKDMFGLRNFQGRSSLSLSDNDHPTTWLRRRRLTVEARNKGGHLTVKGMGAGTDGYYDIGLATDGTQHVMGDDDARGNFKDRGSFIADTGFLFNSSFLYPRFDSYGETDSAVLLGYQKNNQGIECPLFRYTVFLTFNGTKYRAMYSYYISSPTVNVQQYYAFSTGTAMPARYSNGRIGMIRTAVVMTADLQFRPIIVRDHYNGYVTSDYMPCVADQYPWTVYVERLSPTVLMSRTYYKRSELPLVYGGFPVPNLIDNSKCPGYEVRFSYDNGESWVMASSTTFWSEFQTVLDLPTEDTTSIPPGGQDTEANAMFNQAVDYLSMQIAPISATRALCYGIVPYTTYIPDSDSWRLGGKIKIGMIDSAAGTVSEISTLYHSDNEINKVWLNLGNQGFGSFRGGVIMGRLAPANPENPNVTDSIQVGYTVDGGGITWWPAAGIPSYQTGFFHALSPTEMGWVVFVPGQGYVLKSSHDFGASWQDRALVTANGVPPSAANFRPWLTQFVVVSRLRVQGEGANPYQGTPWVSDSSVRAPT